MSQPEWECIAQLGDKNPTEHGGYWIFRDKTGVYQEEAEYLKCPDPDEDDPKGFGPYLTYRFILEKCTYVNGVLSDNPFHPDHPAWFAGTEQRKRERPQDTTYLCNVADASDIEEEELIRLFCSDDPLERAVAYRAVGECHGFENFDDPPLSLRRRECRKRFDTARYKVKK